MTTVNVLQTIPVSATRVALVFDAATPAAALVPANYAVARRDGAGTAGLAVAYVWARDPTSVELVFGAPLGDGVEYVVTAPLALTAPAGWRWAAPLPEAVGGLPAASDPEAEAFGVDWDWWAPALDASGDLPELRGRRCMVEDLAAIATFRRGELFHRPDEGAGLDDGVNGPATDDALADATRALRVQWSRDDRVQRLVQLSADVDPTDGTTTYTARVKSVALDDALDVYVSTG